MILLDKLIQLLYVNNWDWIAFLVSLISLIVAIYSFCVARKTLASQKNTEKNTQPRINNGVQKLLMEKLSIMIFDSFTKIAALKIILSKLLYKYYPSEEILTLSKLDVDAFHLELFYEKPLLYYPFEGLKGKVIKYNELIDVLNNHLKNSHIPNDFLDSSIVNILYENLIIYEQWKGCMSKIFEYKKDDFIYILKERILSFILMMILQMIMERVQFT